MLFRSWGVKNGTELQRIVPGFSVQQEVSLVEGMKKLMPIYRVIGKIQIVRNISNKIIVLEKRGRSRGLSGAYIHEIAT